jgi:hypothetical protein
MRSATFQPTIPSVAWPVTKSEKHNDNPPVNTSVKTTTANATQHSTQRVAKQGSLDEFGLNEEDDLALMQLAGSRNIEEGSQSFEDIDTAFTRIRMQSSTQRPGKLLGQRDQKLNKPALLPNGRYHCQHRCKDKRKCSHKCCQDGMDHPPKESKQVSTQPAKSRPSNSNNLSSKTQAAMQSGTQNTLRRLGSGIGELDLTAEPNEVRDKAPAKWALQQLRAKAGMKNQQQITQGKTYDVHHRDNQDDFQLPNFDDEELDDILDSDAKSGYMLAGETMQYSEPMDPVGSDGPLLELSSILEKKDSRNGGNATAEDDTQETIGEYEDDDFDNYVNWEAVEVPIYDNNDKSVAMTLNQGTNDNDNNSPSRMATFTAPLIAAIPSASAKRKRPSTDYSTNPIPIVSSSVRNTSTRKVIECNILSPSKRSKSMVPAAKEMAKKATSYALDHEDIADEKKAELKAWFNTEFGHCAVLVDISEQL